MIILFLIIAVGFTLRKLKIMEESFDSQLSKLVLDLALPCMIIAAVLSNDNLPDEATIGTILFFSFACYFVMLAVAVILPILLRFKKSDRGAYRFMMVFGNTGFIGFPVLASLFGQGAILYAAIFNIPFNLFVFTIGVLLLSDSEGSLKERLLANAKNILSPTLIACLAAVFLALLRITDTGIIGQTFNIVGQMTTPAALLIIGSSLARYPLFDMVTNIRVYLATAIRLLLMPLVMYFIFSPFITDPLLLGTILILSGMPVATNGALICIRYGGNLKLILQGTFVSTILSLITIPVLSLLLM